jgi:hypothetical protein
MQTIHEVKRVTKRKIYKILCELNLRQTIVYFCVNESELTFKQISLLKSPKKLQTID